MTLYIHVFISRNESSIARRERLRMIWKTQVGHKIHVRIDWWTFFFHPTPPWRRNGGSKICLECKITRFFPKSDGLDWGDRGHLVASTATLGYRIHVGVDWWTQNFYPRPPSAPEVDQKFAQNPKISDFAWRAYRFLEIVPYLHLFISRNESSVARRECLRMIWKTQVGHKIHVQVDWWTLFFHPRPPWRRTMWPWSPQSKPFDLVKKRVNFHSEQIFDPPFRPQGGLGCKKKYTNRLGHDFCVRSGFYRSFGVVLGELSRIHFAK